MKAPWKTPDRWEAKLPATLGCRFAHQPGEGEVEGVTEIVGVWLGVRLADAEAVGVAVGVQLRERVRVREGVKSCDGVAVAVIEGDELRVRVAVLLNDRDAVRVAEKEGESDEEPDGDPDGEGELLPEREGDAPTVREAVARGVAEGEGVALSPGASHVHDTVHVVPERTSANGATATRNRLNAEAAVALDAVSGSTTRARSPHSYVPAPSYPASSLLATQPKAHEDSAGTGHPVPTNSMESKLVAALQVSTTRLPPDPGTVLVGSSNRTASSPSVSENTCVFFWSPSSYPAPSSAQVSSSK